MVVVDLFKVCLEWLQTTSIDSSLVCESHIMQAPNRGKRLCLTCIHFTDKRDDWKAGCKLQLCECAADNIKQGRSENHGIALCPNYKHQTFIDTSNLRISGHVAGHCEWKCPAVLREVLYHQWSQRLVGEGDWCHCWEPVNNSLSEAQYSPLALPGRKDSNLLP